MNYKVTVTEDGVGALNMAINQRRRQLEINMRQATSEQWRQTAAAELEALNQAQDALQAAEHTTI